MTDQTYNAILPDKGVPVKALTPISGGDRAYLAAGGVREGVTSHFCVVILSEAKDPLPARSITGDSRHSLDEPKHSNHVITWVTLTNVPAARQQN